MIVGTHAVVPARSRRHSRFLDDFSIHPIGEDPVVGWSAPFKGVKAHIDETNLPRHLQVHYDSASPGPTYVAALLWERTAEGLANSVIDLRWRMRAAAGSNVYAGGWMFGTGDPATYTGYELRQSAGPRTDIIKWRAGVEKGRAFVAGGPTSAGPFGIEFRMRAERVGAGVVVRARSWKVGELEPAAWLVSLADNNLGGVAPYWNEGAHGIVTGVTGTNDFNRDWVYWFGMGLDTGAPELP